MARTNRAAGMGVLLLSSATVLDQPVRRAAQSSDNPMTTQDVSGSTMEGNVF